MKNDISVIGDVLIIASNGKQTSHLLDDISFINVDKHACKIYFGVLKFLKVNYCLDDLERILPQISFYRPHASFLFNFRILLDAVMENSLIIYFTHEIKISESKSSECRARYKEYLDWVAANKK